MKVRKGQRPGVNTIKYKHHTCPKIPHGKVTQTQLNITNESQEVSYHKYVLGVRGQVQIYL